MNPTQTIQLNADNALPNGNAAESASILALWQEVQNRFRECRFDTACGSSIIATYTVKLNAGAMIASMERALRTAGSFDAWRQEHARDGNNSLAASLVLDIAGAKDSIDEEEAYEVATLFLQQLVIAINLVQPGACRLLQTTFKGNGGHRYEAQAFDSRLYYGAFRNLRDLGWWQRHNPGFDKVWQWLERTEGSHGPVALRNLDKVLFTMLKVAEQRNELGSRTALLVIYQLEMLLDCRSPMDARHLRQRLRLVLGNVPEAADCIHELYAVREGLLLGSRPVRRPPLIVHDSVSEFMEQVDQHNNAVELGTALVLVLLRELISHDAQGFAFTESMALQPVASGTV